MTPDDPDLLGTARGTLPPLASDRRPLTEYGTAQRFLRLFTPAPGMELEPSDWEQGPAAREELRRADPALVTPVRPLSGVALGRPAPLIAAKALEAMADTGEAPTAALSATEVTLEAAVPVDQEPAPAPTTANVPVGAVPGDGTATCPTDFPVKGNASSMIYHTPESRAYAQTIPEFCFSTVEAAQAAGYHPPKQL